MDDTEFCVCGHVRDEHDRLMACEIDDCGCVYFEPADDGDDLSSEQPA